MDDCLLLFVLSHIDYPKSREMFFECLTDIGLGLWGEYLGNVKLD